MQSVIISHILSASLPYVILHRFAKAKCHAIFSDGYLNSRHIIHLNVYQNLMLTALKMHEYLRDWGTGSWINYSFLRGKYGKNSAAASLLMVVLSGVVKKTIFYNYTSIQNQVKRKGMQESRLNTGIHKEAVAW